MTQHVEHDQIIEAKSFFFNRDSNSSYRFDCALVSSASRCNGGSRSNTSRSHLKSKSQDPFFLKIREFTVKWGESGHFLSSDIDFYRFFFINKTEVIMVPVV